MRVLKRSRPPSCASLSNHDGSVGRAGSLREELRAAIKFDLAVESTEVDDRSMLSAQRGRDPIDAQRIGENQPSAGAQHAGGGREQVLEEAM